MPKCPKCHEEINMLQARMVVYCNVLLSDEGELIYPDGANSEETATYECPECCYEICDSPVDAVGFLNGEPSDAAEQEEELKRKVNNRMFG